jgi:hypothetical protein
LDLLQNIENPDNLKELKGIMGNRSWNDFLGVLKDLHKVHQNATDEIVVLEDQQQKLHTQTEISRDTDRNLYLTPN